jgi:hypothetical protein
MGKKKPKAYSVQFKFTVVLEALKAEKAEGEITWPRALSPTLPLLGPGLRGGIINPVSRYKQGPEADRKRCRAGSPPWI